MLPTFVGIGAPKAGTTWLFRCLAEHPDVFMASVKETNFFDWDHVGGRLDEYESHFVRANSARAVGEISVRYFASALAAARIAETLPDVRLFVSLRNPVDQVYSHFWHLRRQNFHQGAVDAASLGFEEALRRYERELLAPARLSEHLDRWIDSMGRDRLLVLVFDDLRDRPREVLRALYHHVGVDRDFVPPSLTRRGGRVREGVAPRSPGHAAAYARLSNSLSRFIYQPLKRTVGTARAVAWVDRLRVRELLQAGFFRRGYPPMSPATRAMLAERLEPEIRAVEALTGRDLGTWRAPGRGAETVSG